MQEDNKTQTTPSIPQPQPNTPPAVSNIPPTKPKYLILVVGGVAILVISVAAFFLLRPATTDSSSSNTESPARTSYSVETPEGFNSKEIETAYNGVEVKDDTKLIELSMRDKESDDYQATKKIWLEDSNDDAPTKVETLAGIEFVVVREYDTEDNYTYIDAITPLPDSNGYIRITAHFKGNDTTSFEKYVPGLIKTVKHS